jgi:hypothetical protein
MNFEPDVLHFFRSIVFSFVLSQIGFYQISKPGEEERVVRYEADDEHGFNANVTYNNPSGNGYVFQNRFPFYCHAFFAER